MRDDLIDRLKLADGRDDCTCKVACFSPDQREHDPLCAYRCLKESAAELSRLRATNARLLEALREMLTPIDHLDGCLFKANRNMPCQCGWHDRVNKTMDRARAAIAAAEGGGR